MPAGTCATIDQRTVEARAEALGQQVVGLARRLVLRQVAGVAEAEADRQHRERQQDQRSQPADQEPATGGAGSMRLQRYQKVLLPRLSAGGAGSGA